MMTHGFFLRSTAAATLLLALTLTSRAQQKAAAQQALDRQQPVYIENRGQWDPQAKYLIRSGGLDVWITDDGVVYDIYRIERKEGANGAEYDSGTDNAAVTVRRAPVFMRFVNAAEGAAARGTSRAEGYHNYLLGNDPAKWAMNVPIYRKMQIENLYNGIDAVFYLDGGEPRYDLVVAPGADVSQVAMQFDGAQKIGIDAHGSLVISTALGQVQQRELYAYQEHDGERRQVRCAFLRDNNGTVRFDVGDYDRTKPLVVDPVMIAYSTYLGGNVYEEGRGIAVDGSGNAYIAGMTYSGNFPTQNAAQSSYGGNGDAFVTKLTSSGALSYSTYLGGSGDDRGFSIAVDGSSNAYITGLTQSTNFPRVNAAQTSKGGGTNDAFATKLTSAGALSYSTYLGGSSEDLGLAIAVDGSGNAHVTGYTNSTNFPMSNAQQSTKSGDFDAFVTKLTSSGAFSYSTYRGGSAFDGGYGIVTDGSGNVYVAGTTSSTNFPTQSPTQSSNAGGTSDAFILKMSSSGTLSYSTYFGGSGEDNGGGIILDGSGNIYFTGATASTNFPTQSAVQSSNAGGTFDAFMTKLTSSGTISYSTYLGGSGEDRGGGIGLDGSGNIYLSGTTASTNFPTLNAAQTSNAGGKDIFVTKLTSTGSYSYSTYLGGSGDDAGGGTADASGNVYLTGSTASTNFPTQNAIQSSLAATPNAFVTKLFAFTDNALPVELVGFSLSANNNRVTVAWRTASEVRNAGFEVQRSTESDSTFALIASYLDHPQLTGLGTSSLGKSYSLVDDDLAPGLYRYRLVDVSTDGIRTTHEAKSIRVEKSDAVDVTFLRLYALTPNPVSSDMQISFSLPEEMVISLEIYTSDGRLMAVPVKSQSRTMGQHSIRVNVAALAPGAYTLRLTAGSGSRTEQFIVVR
jgi:hypothetical protein